MKYLLVILMACTFSCGKNKGSNSTPIAIPQNPQQKLAAENEAVQRSPQREKSYELKRDHLKIDFSKETTEVTVEIKPQFSFEAFYKNSKYYLPLREYIPHPVMGYYIDREDLECPVQRKVYQNHKSLDVSSQLVKEEDIQFIFNGERIQPELMNQSPKIFKLDFRTLKAKRELIVKNKTVQTVRMYKDNKSECDRLIKRNSMLEVFPLYKDPTELASLPNYRSFSIKVVSQEN